MGRRLSDAEILSLPRKVKAIVSSIPSQEKPVTNEVRLNSFWISVFPVTQFEWNEVMKINPSRNAGKSFPVESISWFDAVNYCNSRSIHEGLQPCYSMVDGNYFCDFTATGYRLPTEAEWEYAARGGVKTESYIFSGSNDVFEVSWNSVNSKKKLQEVGQKLPNELGIYDMSGNINEWCWDWFSTNLSYDCDNPTGPSKSPVWRKRSVRGGCYLSSPHLLHIGHRLGRIDCSFNDHLGMRVVRTGI